MSFFIVVNSDSADYMDNAVSGETIADYRLRKGVYPYYKGTPFKEAINSGDLCLFYVAGTKSDAKHSFVGQAVVIKNDNSRTYDEDSLHVGMPAAGALVLGDVETYINPIKIKPILPRLTFIKNKKVWGVHFQQGILRVSEEDFRTITNQL